MNNIARLSATHPHRSPASATSPALVKRLVTGLATAVLLSGGVGAAATGAGLAGIAHADPAPGHYVVSSPAPANVVIERHIHRLPQHRPVRRRPHAHPATQAPGWYGGYFHCGGAIPCSLFP